MLQNDVSCDHILHATLKMPNFTVFSEILSELPVPRSDDHQINIFQISAKKCFNLKYNFDHLSMIFLFHIMTVRDVKMCLVVSRDLSTDKHNQHPKTLSNSTKSDSNINWIDFDHYFRSGSARMNFDLLEIS